MTSSPSYRFGVFRILALSFVLSGLTGVSLATEVEWHAKVAADDEPGQRLVVTGQVFSADGKTPLADIELFVYQTDITGHYSADGQQNRQKSRLQATLTTNSEGRYELHTIRPGPYPGGRVPAHIHFVLTPPGGASEQQDLFFSDDPALSNRQRQAGASGDRFSAVQSIRTDPAGVSRVVRDIRLEASGR